MKDIYELLNDLDIKEDDFEEVEVSEIERARVKKHLKKSIRHKKTRGKAGAVAAIAIVCTVVLGGTITTYAENIPIIKDIFKTLNNGVYREYKENANELNVIKTSKGSSITINDALFDGRVLSLTYTVVSEKDLGEEINLSINYKFSGLNKSGWNSSSRFIKVDDKTYIGQENITIFDLVENPQENISVTVDIDSIRSQEEAMDIIKGNWNFSINIEAVQGKVLLVNENSLKDGIIAKVKNVTINPMSTFISYSHELSEEVLAKWDSVYLELEVRDDLGNIYEVEHHGSSGDRLTNNYSATTDKLKEGATKLIITPKTIVKDLEEAPLQPLEYKDNIIGTTTVKDTEAWDCTEIKELIFEDIVIDIK